MNEWQPIETAPKDGSLVDVWLGNAEVDEVEFYCDRGTRRATGWHYRNGKFRPHMGLGLPVVTVTPTHWMPLPAPPSGAAAKADE